MKYKLLKAGEILIYILAALVVIAYLSIRSESYWACVEFYQLEMPDPEAFCRGMMYR